MTTHELKCWPEFFCHILSGEKTFEVRKDDRGFRAGDELRLREWVNDGTGYTGREVTVRVTYLLAGKPWLEKDYVVMGFQPHKSGTHEDTRRLRRFAEMALAVEGKDETFGSQLTADRELGFLREDFLGEHAKGADAYTAFCRAIDNLTDSAELPPKPGGSE